MTFVLTSSLFGKLPDCFSFTSFFFVYRVFLFESDLYISHEQLEKVEIRSVPLCESCVCVFFFLAFFFHTIKEKQHKEKKKIKGKEKVWLIAHLHTHTHTYSICVCVCVCVFDKEQCLVGPPSFVACLSFFFRMCMFSPQRSPLPSQSHSRGRRKGKKKRKVKKAIQNEMTSVRDGAHKQRASQKSARHIASCGIDVHARHASTPCFVVIVVCLCVIVLFSFSFIFIHVYVLIFLWFLT